MYSLLFLNFKNLIDKNVKYKKPISTIYSPNLKPNISNPTKDRVKIKFDTTNMRTDK